jgi:HlyD family secretion protein
LDIPRQDISKRHRRRRLVAAGSVGLVVLAVGLAATLLGPSIPRVDRRALQIDTVVQGELVRRVRGTGTLVSRDERRIVTTSDGRVETVLVRPGATVEKASVLVVLSNREAEQMAAEARWAFDAAVAELAALRAKLDCDLLEQRAKIAEAKSTYELARLEAATDAELTAEGVVPGLQAARSRLAAEGYSVRLEVEKERLAKIGISVRAEVRAQEARVEVLHKTWERRQAVVDELSVRAGLDGVLQQLNADPGQRIPAGTEIARVARPGLLRAELKVPEIDAKDLAVGQSCTVDTRNGTVAGRVERVNPSVQDGTVKVDVELTGPLPQGARADLAVDGVIEIERLRDVRHVARPVNVRAEASTTMFRLGANGVAVRVPVRLGKASVDRVVILDGLSPGDQVIVSDLSDHVRHNRLEVK